VKWRLSKTQVPLHFRYLIFSLLFSRLIFSVLLKCREYDLVANHSSWFEMNVAAETLKHVGRGEAKD
jgi:hypothetical protein